MHQRLFAIGCVLTLIGWFVGIAPGFEMIIFALAAAVCLVGVPHGGLDHWTGKSVFGERFGNRWWIPFLSGYLVVGAIVAAGWFVQPLITAIAFFLIAAWHFGLEDLEAKDSGHHRLTPRVESESGEPEQSFDKSASDDSTRTGAGDRTAFQGEHANQASGLLEQGPVKRTHKPTFRDACAGHGFAVATGGLVIWVASIFQATAMREVLSMIVPSSLSGSAGKIVTATQVLAGLMLPLALLGMLCSSRLRSQTSIQTNVLVSVLAAVMSPLISFGIYFCGWHSIRGLKRLQQEFDLNGKELAYFTAPLSLAAVLMCAGAAWVFTDANGVSEATTQALFVGLSAIAVPHLLLHSLHLGAPLVPNEFSASTIKRPTANRTEVHISGPVQKTTGGPLSQFVNEASFYSKMRAKHQFSSFQPNLNHPFVRRGESEVRFPVSIHEAVAGDSDANLKVSSLGIKNV